MNAKDIPLQELDYCCPGQRHAISRAVHLGRLAAFYPACRQCPHRNDTATLSPRQVEQLQEVETHRRPQSLFHDEGAGGVYLNDFTPADARDVATTFAETAKAEGGRRRAETETGNPPSALRLPPFPNPQSLIPNPSILLAGDNRPITAELTAAVAEGIRASGCDVVDVGPSTAACLAFSVRHHQAAGGILVGNPSRQPHRVGMQFWSAEAMPFSMGAIVERYQAHIDRRSRNYGELHRRQAEPPYLAAIGEQYHALRPLRVVVDSASHPLVRYFQQLAASVACHVIPSRVASHDLPEHIRNESAHFAACIDGDGETCQVFDQRGEAVSSERLLLLLARHGSSKDVILEQNVSQSLVERLEQHGLHPILSGARRAEIASAMREHGAILGGGPSGRFWHNVAEIPLPDALMTITRLLVILSRSDDPFSVVLDRDAPLG
jgi:phosphomannomutase